MQKLVVLLILILSLGLKTMSAQTKNISGKVVDDSGESIPGVSISVKGSTIGTVTGPDGTYAISVPKNASSLLLFICRNGIKRGVH